MLKSTKKKKLKTIHVQNLANPSQRKFIQILKIQLQQYHCSQIHFPPRESALMFKNPPSPASTATLPVLERGAAAQRPVKNLHRNPDIFRELQMPLSFRQNNLHSEMGWEGLSKGNYTETPSCYCWNKTFFPWFSHQNLLYQHKQRQKTCT